MLIRALTAGRAAWLGLTRRTGAAVAAAVVVPVGLIFPAVHADATLRPRLADGFGLTQVASATGTPTDFVITVTTPEVAGRHHIRILLPSDYAARPAKRYPVLYLLPGASDDPSNNSLAAPALTTASMITVIPDGGLRGWYTDWADQHTAAGAQNWETFHLDQVIPFIDANLRTIAAKQDRAVAGISMGGFGALHYAEHRPDLFGQVASLSGADDFSAAVRIAVLGTELNATNPLCGPGSLFGVCPFGPTVPGDAIFGSPVWPFDGNWNAQDASVHADKLAGLGVSIYTGNGQGGGTAFARTEEALAEPTARHLAATLNSLGNPAYFVDYGNGSTWGGSCDGAHDYGCWTQDLADFVPRVEQSFAVA